ncbi:D-alanine--D-alanine ligase [Synechococcus sp. KORDI-52]|uniref:D-alanine--D-alanine ligase family protein n=1 Tax=Synechococcus sp. KORDI-52 TaxID=585425 RepID=UPI0004E036C6|nr:D-alanine--D-alanine ligase family protein [Synechococcus sp. KORDI-52]AII49987.1 D-alanine--D-alanine ligase [Synechococcus sp. KORDI-52]
MPSSPITVGLVFGGRSGEHEVSIRSAATVVRGLRSGNNTERYTVQPIYIDRDGRWWGKDLAEETLATETAPNLSPPLPPSGFQGFPEGSEAVDIWYPVLHGPNGEDGTIQGLFQLTGKPFVGAGVLGSAVSMDKQAMKSAFASAGLSQVPYVALHASELEDANSRSTLLDRIESELTYPCFVKPANLGSSVGISKVRSRTELEAGLNQAAALDPRLVVEQGVNAREVECAVLGGRRLEASVVGEVRFDADWYDYETKYTAGRSSTLIPAPLPDPVTERIRTQALQACAAVGVDGMGRVDFFYDDANDQLWINEINTLPGFTAQSMFPMLWAASGVTLEQLVHQLLQSAGE